MKNKSAVLSVLGLMLFLSVAGYAASGVRGAKQITTWSQTTAPIGVSSATAVLYEVILGTGAVTDFVAVFDSNSVSGLTGASQTTGNFKMRFYPSSATQNTVIVLDPPLQFKNGIMGINATALGSTMFVWESGRVSQGY